MQNATLRQKHNVDKHAAEVSESRAKQSAHKQQQLKRLGCRTETRPRYMSIVMVALWNRADHYIFILWFLLLLLLFPRLISAAADWMSAILPHMV